MRLRLTHESWQVWVNPLVLLVDSVLTVCVVLAGVGGIEAEAVMLGQPISMVLPKVVGYKLVGKLGQLATSTDVVLTITKVRCNWYHRHQTYLLYPLLLSGEWLTSYNHQGTLQLIPSPSNLLALPSTVEWWMTHILQSPRYAPTDTIAIKLTCFTLYCWVVNDSHLTITKVRCNWYHRHQTYLLYPLLLSGEWLTSYNHQGTLQLIPSPSNLLALPSTVEWWMTHILQSPRYAPTDTIAIKLTCFTLYCWVVNDSHLTITKVRSNWYHRHQTYLLYPQLLSGEWLTSYNHQGTLQLIPSPSNLLALPSTVEWWMTHILQSPRYAPTDTIAIKLTCFTLYCWVVNDSHLTITKVRCNWYHRHQTYLLYPLLLSGEWLTSYNHQGTLQLIPSPSNLLALPSTVEWWMTHILQSPRYAPTDTIAIKLTCFTLYCWVVNDSHLTITKVRRKWYHRHQTYLLYPLLLSGEWLTSYNHQGTLQLIPSPSNLLALPSTVEWWMTHILQSPRYAPTDTIAIKLTCFTLYCWVVNDSHLTITKVRCNWYHRHQTYLLYPLLLSGEWLTSYNHQGTLQLIPSPSNLLALPSTVEWWMTRIFHSSFFIMLSDQNLLPPYLDCGSFHLSDNVCPFPY